MPSDTHNEVAQVRGFVLGPWETNCYVVTARETDACWIVDAGFDPGPMIDHIKAQRLKPERILLTHAHVDHIAGVREILKALGDVPIWNHEAERAFLNDPTLNLSAFVEMSITTPDPSGALEDGQELSLGDTQWRVLHTPGHSPGGIVLYHEAGELAIVGDTLFAGSIGRSDFPTSNQSALFDSIRTKILTLPDDTTVYPGHGESTTVGRERVSNPFVGNG